MSQWLTLLRKDTLISTSQKPMAPVNTAELRGNITEKCFNPKINKVCQPQCCVTDINSYAIKFLKLLTSRSNRKPCFSRILQYLIGSAIGIFGRSRPRDLISDRPELLENPVCWRERQGAFESHLTL
jgi:hypothetical protein